MASNIDNLNFKVILDDKDFNTRVEKDIELAKKLNVELSQLLQAKVKVNAISATEAASAKRASDILTKQATNQEKVSQAKAKTAEAEEKVATQAAKTAKEMERSKAAASQTAVNVQRLATEQQRTTAATQNAAAATSRAALAQRRLRDYASQTTNTIRTQNRLMSELKGYALGYLSIHGATQLISSLVRVTGEFELQKTILAAMLGDLNEAEQIITRIQGLAVESPFQFKELTTYAKQLSAFSVPAEELYETTKMLADVSAGLGVGMDRIVLAYGQVRSAAFLRGQEVRQFTEAGIPILDELAKQFTELEGRAVSTGEVFDKISARLVPFEMVAKVFKDMTSEGGKFYQMQEVQAETLRGKISNLKDAYEVMLNEIGSAHSNKLKGAVDGVRRLLQNWESIGRTLVDLIKLFGAYKIAVGVLAISDTIAKFGSLAKAIRSTAIAQRVLNSAMMTNPYIAFGMAVMTVALAIRRQRQELYDTTRAQQDYNERVKDLERAERERVNNVRNLIDLVQDETQATLEREAALLSLKESYPEIFEQYDIETIKLADILRIKKQIAEEDAKQKKLGALGAIAGQQGRINVRIAQGAGDNIIESELKYLREMQKDFLKRYVLPELVAGLKGLSNEELQKELDKAFRGSEYGKIGLESFYDVPTSQDFYKDLYSAIQAEIKRRNNVKLAEGWRKKIQDTLTDMGLDAGTSFGLWTTESTQSVEYVDDMVKRYKELAEQIKMVSSFDKEQTKRLQQNKDAIEAVSKALGINIKELAASKSEKAESVAERQLKAEIDLVKKLQDSYGKLSDFLSADQMKATLANLFPEAKKEWIESLDFSEILRKMADELEKYDKEAAERLRASVGKDMAGDIASVFKAIEQYKKTLESWMGEDFNLTGEGVTFDISKIISDLNNQYAKINEKAIKASNLLTEAQMGDEEALKVVREVYGEEVWQKYLTNGKAVIDELARKEREASRKTADEKIRDLASKYVKEQMGKKNIDLSDMEDKSVAQIQALIDRMKEIQEEAQKMAGESLAEMFMGNIDEGQYAQWQMLLDVIDQLRQKIDDTEEELNDKILDTTLDGIDSISKLGGEIASLGEAVGNSDLAKLGQTMERTAQAASGIIKALEADDTISLISNIVSYAITSITDVFAAAYKQQHALNEATEEYRQLLLDIRRETYSGVFGTDEIGLAAENAKILAEAQKQYEDALSKFEDEKKLRRNKYTDTIAFQKKSVADILNEIAGLQGWSLYDEAGELDLEALKANYDAYYDHLTNKQKAVVDAVIAGYNAQDEAARHSAEYLTELFSDVADNIAENMIDAFLESGDAAIDMGDVISDVSRKMVADLIKSIYLMPILNSYKEQFDAIESDQSLSPTEKTEAHLRNLDSALYEISNKSDEITAALEGIEEYFGSGETGTKDLGESIQGITEDQANLLASYLNAIRADVSSSKAIWSRMDGNLQRIADMFASSPTLMEYQAQIAANTYNTAIATQDILAELRSVITTDSGDTAIRVYS